MSSIEPYTRSGEVDAGQKVLGKFVVASRDGSEWLEFLKKVFDPMAGFVEVFIVLASDHAVALGRDYSDLASRLQRPDHPVIGIVGFVGEYCISLQEGKSFISTLPITGLSSGQKKANGVAQGIGRGVDLGTQTAFAAPDSRVFALFFLAPALCGCARTIVRSIIAYSLSASLDHSLKTNAQTPRPMAEAGMNCSEMAKAGGKVSPGNPGPIPIEYRLDQQAMVFSRHPHIADFARQ